MEDRARGRRSIAERLQGVPVEAFLSPRVTSARTLRIAFGAVAAAFTLTIAVTQIANVRIRAMAEDITSDTSPTIALLSSMRSTIRELEAAADELVDECETQGCTPVPAKLEALRNRLRMEWAQYRLLPSSPEERDAWPRVEGLLRTLDGELTALFALLARSEVASAEALFRARVRPSFDALDEGVASIVQFDHAYGVSLASKIDVLARRAMASAMALVALSVALTVLTAALAIAIVRRHERMLRLQAEELDRYAGRVAHEVSGPLWAASAALDVASHTTDRHRRDALERAARSVELGKQLAKGLLEFARSGVVRDADTGEDLPKGMEAVADTLRSVAEQNGVELRFEPPLEGRVACGNGILESIVANLAENAIKHMGDVEPRRVMVRTRHGGARDRLRVEVEDTGPGIPAALGEKVFEPFIRGPDARSPGFGLGLATVKRLVTAHGGDVGFAPRTGGGTVFWVEMPRARARTEAGASPLPPTSHRPVVEAD
jgi:signal transduction histidine kinase